MSKTQQKRPTPPSNETCSCLALLIAVGLALAALVAVLW